MNNTSKELNFLYISKLKKNSTKMKTHNFIDIYNITDLELP